MLGQAFVCLYGLLIVLTVRVAFTMVPYSRFCTWMECAQRRQLPLRVGAISPVNILAAVDFGARLVPGSTCLVKCHAARLLYSWSGTDSILHFGVARSATSQIIAHAWLEVGGGIVLGEADDRHFTELAEHLV
jgi:hypothetical protein